MLCSDLMVPDSCMNGRNSMCRHRGWRGQRWGHVYAAAKIQHFILKIWIKQRFKPKWHPYSSSWKSSVFNLNRTINDTNKKYHGESMFNILLFFTWRAFHLWLTSESRWARTTFSSWLKDLKSLSPNRERALNSRSLANISFWKSSQKLEHVHLQ